MFESLLIAQVEESRIGDQFTVGESQFSQSLTMRNQGCDWLVANEFARMEVNFKDVGTVFGKGYY